MTNRSLVRTFGLLGASALLAVCVVGCKSSSANATNTTAINDGTAPTGGNADPADANLAPASGSTQVLATNASYTPQQQGETYPQQAPAPIVQGYNDQAQADEDAGQDAVDEYADQAPPPLPEYDQPPAPEDNYIWTPGYWAWGPGGYYWVPGVWCPPPYYGALWTPPYWGYYGGRYGFHHGYWGPHIGYYGGIDYGFGYIGIGYFGGYWNGNNFYYNRAVTNVGRVGNVYSRPVVYNNVTYTGRIRNNVSYNGGRGGINVRPRPAELAARRETRTAPLPEQRQVAQAAAQNKQQFYSNNRGRPAQVAQTRPIASTRPIAATPPAVARERQQANQTRENAARPGNGGQQRPGAPERPGSPATQPGRPATGQPGNQQRPAPRNSASTRN